MSRSFFASHRHGSTLARNDFLTFRSIHPLAVLASSARSRHEVARIRSADLSLCCQIGFAWTIWPPYRSSSLLRLAFTTEIAKRARAHAISQIVDLPPRESTSFAANLLVFTTAGRRETITRLFRTHFRNTRACTVHTYARRHGYTQTDCRAFSLD